MTIATFCRDELLAHGPLTLDDLAARAVAAGVTRSANPTTSVRQAIAYGEVELADGRWATPLQLLEGRCLTTASLRRAEWDVDSVDTSDLDLELLRRAARLRPVPVVGGGEVAVPRYGGQLTWLADVALVELDEVSCLRVVGGALEISSIRREHLETPEAERFVKALNRTSAVRTTYGPHARDTANRVANLLVEDAEHLRTPAPPLSWCCDELREEAAARLRRRREQELQRWHPYAEPEADGLITVRLTQQQAEVLQRLAAALRDALPDPFAEERWYSSTAPLRLLP